MGQFSAENSRSPGQIQAEINNLINDHSLMVPSRRLILLLLGATCAYLGLAIWGAGGWMAFFSHPPLISIVIATFAMTLAGIFSEGNLSSGLEEDLSQSSLTPDRVGS